MFVRNGAGPSTAPPPADRVNQVQKQVDDVKAVMQENVEVMLANIDKAEVLENKAGELAAQAKTFHKTARDTKRTMCRQNAKMNLLIGCICLIAILVVTIPIVLQVSPGGGGGNNPSPSSAPPPPAPPVSPASGRRSLFAILEAMRTGYALHSP